MIRTPREEDNEDYDNDEDGEFNPWDFFDLEAQIQNGLIMWMTNMKKHDKWQIWQKMTKNDKKWQKMTKDKQKS